MINLFFKHVLLGKTFVLDSHHISAVFIIHLGSAEGVVWL
jgi:hypothetical protein